MDFVNLSTGDGGILACLGHIYISNGYLNMDFERSVRTKRENVEFEPYKFIGLRSLRRRAPPPPMDPLVHNNTFKGLCF